MLTRIQSLFDLDRLNPIIVKEIRQGNRSMGFLINFLLAHIAMLLFVVVALSNVSSASSNDMKGMNIGFWMLFGFFLLVGVPLTGFNAINKERAEARLDLLHLTRLSALRIVRGKWLALVSQSCLITFSILPYVIIRYYFGGVNVVNDLLTIALLLACSAFVAGLMVGLSSLKSIIIRVIAVGGVLWAGSAFVSVVSMSFSPMSRMLGLSTGPIDFLTPLMITLAELGLVLVLALEFSASTICPLAENHQSRMRLWYLAQLSLLGSLLFFVDEKLVASLGVFSMMLGVCICCSALVQTPVALSSVYIPFLRRGRIGRWMGRFLLYPGYPSGVFYTLFCVSFYFVAFFVFVWMKEPHMLDEDKHFFAYYCLYFPTVVSCFLTPLALALLMPNDRFRLSVRYAVIVFILVLLGILSVTISQLYSVSFSYLFILDPFSNLFAFMSFKFWEFNGVVYGVGSSVSTVLSLFYVLKRGAAWRRVERELETDAAALLAEIPKS